MTIKATKLIYATLNPRRFLVPSRLEEANIKYTYFDKNNEYTRNTNIILLANMQQK